MRYLEVGPTDGPVVFLLHGYTDTSRSWSLAMKALHRLLPDLDSDVVEQEIDLALMAKLSPKGWTLKARLMALDGQIEERVYTCGRTE
jgi:hypothetical protein